MGCTAEGGRAGLSKGILSLLLALVSLPSSAFGFIGSRVPRGAGKGTPGAAEPDEEDEAAALIVVAAPPGSTETTPDGSTQASSI